LQAQAMAQVSCKWLKFNIFSIRFAALP